MKNSRASSAAILRICFSVVAALWLALFDHARSSEQGRTNCKLVGWYVSKAVFLSDGGKLEYSVRVSNPNWEIESFGWHANAMFGCSTCEPGSIRDGILWFSPGNGSTSPPTKEQDDTFMKNVASTWFAHSDDRNPRAIGEQVSFSWAGFNAYARRYEAKSANGEEADLYAITATDGCVVARLYASRPHEQLQDDADQLRKLLSSIRLSFKWLGN